MDGSPYLCYDARPQPYKATPITASIRLLPPLPQSGTIMTGFNGYGMQFGISLKNSKVVYELITNGTTSIPLIITSQTTLSLGSSYQLNYYLTANHTAISIGQFVGDSLSPLETMSRLLTPTLVRSDFQQVCLGGALLEDINYSGHVENVFFNQLSLTEEKYFTLFRATSTSRSSVIKFNEMKVPPLQFTKSAQNVSRISFDIRIDVGTIGNNILLLGNESLYFILTTLNGLLYIFHNLIGDPIKAFDYSLNNGLWHHFEVDFITDSPTGIMVKVSQSTNISMFFPTIIDNLQHLMKSPIQFGPTTIPIMFFGELDFTHCMQNIEFEYEFGETFRPNLEAVTRLEERFSATGCFGCTADQESMAGCRNGGTCQYRNDTVGGECSCKLDYSGPQCEGE